MKTYQIRIMPQEQAGADLYSSAHLNAYAAARPAMVLAKPGQAIEVRWGTQCVYAGLPAQTASY